MFSLYYQGYSHYLFKFTSSWMITGPFLEIWMEIGLFCNSLFCAKIYRKKAISPMTEKCCFFLGFRPPQSYQHRGFFVLDGSRLGVLTFQPSLTTWDTWPPYYDSHDQTNIIFISPFKYREWLTYSIYIEKITLLVNIE